MLGELQGFALPAALWEREVLPARIADYGGPLLDQLSTAGEVVWWRPRPSSALPGARATTVATSPIALVPRARFRCGGRSALRARCRGMSGAAERVVHALRERGALFFVESCRRAASCACKSRNARRARRARSRDGDSFTGLRAVLTPQSRRRGFRGRGACAAAAASTRRGAGRCAAAQAARDRRPMPRARGEDLAAPLRRHVPAGCSRAGRSPELARALAFYRTAEARGEIRGGRFVEPFGGEQFALIEAVEELRRLRRTRDERMGRACSRRSRKPLRRHGRGAARCGAEPLDGSPSRNGAAVAARAGPGNAVEWLVELDASAQRQAEELLAPEDRALSPYRARGWSRR